VIAAVLVADGRANHLGSPPWGAAVACATALTAGTILGGWHRRHHRTPDRALHPLDGVALQGASSAVIIAASALGAPVSTTQVVASSVVGVGGGRARWRHVH